MNLPEKPRIVYISDPSYGGPYPYAFAGLPNAMEEMGLDVCHLDSANASFESFKEKIDK